MLKIEGRARGTWALEQPYQVRTGRWSRDRQLCDLGAGQPHPGARKALVAGRGIVGIALTFAFSASSSSSSTSTLMKIASYLPDRPSKNGAMALHGLHLRATNAV